KVRSQDPGALIVACRKTPCHIRQCNVGNAGVKHLHECPQRDNNSNQPGVELRLPEVLIECECRRAHRSSTLGTTFIPGRSRWSPFSPGSRTILTGTRWTIFT